MLQNTRGRVSSKRLGTEKMLWDHRKSEGWCCPIRDECFCEKTIGKGNRVDEGDVNQIYWILSVNLESCGFRLWILTVSFVCGSWLWFLPLDLVSFMRIQTANVLWTKLPDADGNGVAGDASKSMVMPAIMYYYVTSMSNMRPVFYIEMPGRTRLDIPRISSSNIPFEYSE